MYVSLHASGGKCPWWAIIYCNSSSKEPCCWQQLGKFRAKPEKASFGTMVSSSIVTRGILLYLAANRHGQWIELCG